MSTIYLINKFLWGYPILILLMGTHIYFTIRLKFIQKKTFHGIRLSLSPQTKSAAKKHGQSSFSALMTTLAATLGTGNIIGMSTAVALGGPGAVFWCWLTGVLGMATSYAECYLCHHYRITQKNGTITGGPMYIFSNILKQPFTAFVYAFAVVAASLFIGCASQSNSIALTCKSAFTVPPEITGILCAVLLGFVLIGGCKVISRVCSVMVPFMGIFYIFCCLILLIMLKDTIQPALKLILVSAFAKKPMTGGILGSTITATLRYGIARGLFTNEAGMGSAGIAAASAQTADSSRQALISMTGVFWDTVVMCGITGLLIIANVLKNPAEISNCPAGELTLSAFSLLPHGEQILAFSLILFAFSTMIGWFFLGEQGFTYIFRSDTALSIYKSVYLILLFAGAILSLETIWELTDFINLFLLLPNIFLLLKLRKQIS